MDKTEKFWDRTADSFDRNEKRFEQTGIVTIDNTKKYLSKDDVVLDYGCAKGTKSLGIAPYVKKVYGIDISSKMIEGARRNALESHIENVEFSQATIFDNPFGKGTFDIILAFNILHLVEDDHTAVQRIAELLKPGGLFISATPCLAEKMAFSKTIQFSFFPLMRKIGLVPLYVKRYISSDLVALITSAKFDITEGVKLNLGITEYFITAKNIG